MIKTIGVIGSAKGKIDKQAFKQAYEIGREIAKRKLVLVTGACNGLPYEAAKGAKANHGMVIGISPAENLKQHKEVFDYPSDVFDFIVYTGFGLKGRNVVFIRSCDAIVCISGRIGTLNEFTIAHDEGRPIGVINNMGISGIIPDVVQAANKGNTPIVYEADPGKLIAKLVEKISLK